MAYMTFDEAMKIPPELRKRIVAEQILKAAGSFDGMTAAERQIETLAKRSLDAKEYATIEKARAAAWVNNPQLFDQDRTERQSQDFLDRVAKASEAKIAKKSSHAMSTAETQLDTLAKKRAAETGEPYVKAYTAVLDTPEGQRLYAEHRAA